MRVYLACTVRGDRGGVLAGRAIADRLRALGHEVLTAHLLEDGVDEAEASQSERDVFERDREWLNACDAVVAEASGSTYGVGFEVGYVTGRAASTGQRVFVLYDAARRPHVSRLMVGYNDAHGAVYEYRSLDEVRAFIDAHFSAVGPDSRRGG